MTDLSSFYDFSLSLLEACKIKEFSIIYTMLQSALESSNSLAVHRRVLLRANEQYTEFQGQETSLERATEQDRVFPLDTVILKHYNTDIDEAVIHTGPFADEYARSVNALALTIGKDIFFRSNAFNTSDDEGRKTLAHELTHVAQHEENRTGGNDSLDVLEKEAALSEQQEGGNYASHFSIVLNNRTYRIRKSKIDAVAEQIADSIEAKIRKQQLYLDEEEYLKLLLEYKAMLQGGMSYGMFASP